GIHLIEEDGGVDHDAVADHRRDVGVQDPARQQLQGERFPVNHHGVPGVVPALVADHHRHLLGKQIGELALALVAPLGPDDNGSGHATLLRSCLRRSNQHTVRGTCPELPVKRSSGSCSGGRRFTGPLAPPGSGPGATCFVPVSSPACPAGSIPTTSSWPGASPTWSRPTSTPGARPGPWSATPSRRRDGRLPTWPPASTSGAVTVECCGTWCRSSTRRACG